MLRFIELEDQITKGIFEFGFYDTVGKVFYYINGKQTWKNVIDFIEDFIDNSPEDITGYDLEHFLNVIPDYWHNFHQQN